MNLLTRSLALVTTLLILQIQPPLARAGGPFDIGILPGDVVLGNIANFPGHAGIFIGRWQDLPEALQARYADVYERVLIRSRDHGLADSYLVVDSIGGRGVTLRSFAEQFTGYLPNGAKRGSIKQALRFEASMGGAVAWPSLGKDDAKRWSIVEEALKAARARIPYDGSHAQAASMAGYGSRVEWVDGIKTRTRDVVDYDMMQKDGLDCITLVHVVYWRGAGIDLDVSWAPWHTPEQLHGTAKKAGYLRAVLFEDVFTDAALLGKWEVELRVAEMWDDSIELPEKLVLWVGKDDQGQVTVAQAGVDPAVPAGSAVPLPGRLVRSGSDTLTFESINLSGGAEDGGTATMRFEIGADGTMTGAYEGIDPPDSDGEGGGRFKITFTAKKVRDMVVPPA